MEGQQNPPFSVPLTQGKETVVRNPNPEAMQVIIEMARGSFISFTLPSAGEFIVKAMGDISVLNLHVLSAGPRGPRPIEQDRKD